jgi:hypothetical protein
MKLDVKGTRRLYSEKAKIMAEMDLSLNTLGGRFESQWAHLFTSGRGKSWPKLILEEIP